MYKQVMHFPQINILPLQLYVNNAAYVYNEETGEIEMLSQVDSVDDLQVRDWCQSMSSNDIKSVLLSWLDNIMQEIFVRRFNHHSGFLGNVSPNDAIDIDQIPILATTFYMQRPDSVLSLWMHDKVSPCTGCRVDSLIRCDFTNIFSLVWFFICLLFHIRY